MDTMEEMCVTGQVFGTRLVSVEKEQELRDRDAELQHLFEHLKNLRPLTRLPLVSTTCTCKRTWRPSDKTAVSVTSSDSDDSSDDDEGFTLEQVLHAISLYERKPPTRRSPKTLRNLVCSYSGHQEATDEDVTKILELTNTKDPGIGEAAFLLIRQLSMREENAFRFLSRDGMKHALHVLEDVKLAHLHEVAAQVIGKMACHVALGEYWMEHMMTSGLAILKSRISCRNPHNVRYACAQSLVPLATHTNLAILILDQAVDVINTIKEINSDFKEVYAEIITVLAQQTDYTCASILEINSLTEALDMMKQGPCASQKQALVLIATLAESDCGLKGLLEGQAFHYVMSAIEDSECRQVRCTALAALHNALASPKVTFQKQVLVSVDQFFHEHEEGYGLTAVLAAGTTERPKFRLDTESRVSRAVEDLCNMVIKMVHKEARLTKDKKGKVCTVHLAPGIDLDPTLLKTLTHLTQVMMQLGHLNVIPISVKGFDLEGDNGDEYGRIMRRSFGDSNPIIVRNLIDRGATCFLDVLHTYVMRLHVVANIPIIQKDLHNLKGNAQATQAALGIYDQANQNGDSGVIFTESELKLVKTLLELVRMLAMSSCDNDLRDIEQDAKDKMDGSGSNGNLFTKNCAKSNNNQNNHTCNKSNKTRAKDLPGNCVPFTRRDSGEFWGDAEDFNGKNQRSNHNTCECNKMGSKSRPDSHLKDFIDNKSTIQRDALDEGGSEDEGDVVSEAGLLFKETLNKAMHLQRRAVRVKLFESGIIESVAPWLGSKDMKIKGLVLPILRCIIQQVTEFIEPRPAMPEPPPSNVKTRPLSAMTSKERDRALNMALFQMSPGVNTMIKDALGMPPSPPPSPRKAAAQPPSPKIFTIDESQHYGNQCWTAEEQEGNHSGNGLVEPGKVLDNNTIGAMSLREVNEDELFYEDTESVYDDEQDSIVSGLLDGDMGMELPSVKQCLTIPQEDTIEHLPQKEKLLKPYAHDDYHRFARRQSRPQSGKPTQSRPQSAKPAVTNIKQRPTSARITVLATERPGSASKMTMSGTVQRPSTAKSSHPRTEVPQGSKLALLGPQRPQSARVALSQPSRPHNVNVTVRQRPQSAKAPSHQQTALVSNNQRQFQPRPPPSARPGQSSLSSKSTGHICPRSARGEPILASPSLDSLMPAGTNSRPTSASRGGKQTETASKAPVVKLHVTASLRPGSGRKPLTLVGSRPPSATSRPRPTSATSSKQQKKALEDVTRQMKQGQLPWKPTFDKCEPVRNQCCHRVVEVCGRLLIRDLLSRDVTARRAAIVFLQEVIRQSETAVHMKLSECSLIPRLVDYLRVNDENILEEVLGLVVARLLVNSDQRLKHLFSRCGGTELLMCMASSTCGALRTEVASTLKAITKATGFPASTVGLRRTMSAPVGRKLNNEHPDIWDKIMDRWKEEDKVSALLRKNHHK